MYVYILYIYCIIAEEAERIRIEEEQKRLAIEAAKALEETEENDE